MLYHQLCMCLCIYLHCQDVYEMFLIVCTVLLMLYPYSRMQCPLPSQNACKHRAASGWGDGLHAERGIANTLRYCNPFPSTLLSLSLSLFFHLYWRHQTKGFCTFVTQFLSDTPLGNASDSSEGEEDEEEESEPALDTPLPETEGRWMWWACESE